MVSTVVIRNFFGWNIATLVTVGPTWETQVAKVEVLGAPGQMHEIVKQTWVVQTGDSVMLFNSCVSWPCFPERLCIVRLEHTCFMAGGCFAMLAAAS